MILDGELQARNGPSAANLVIKDFAVAKWSEAANILAAWVNRDFVHSDPVGPKFLQEPIVWSGSNEVFVLHILQTVQRDDGHGENVATRPKVLFRRILTFVFSDRREIDGKYYPPPQPWRVVIQR